MATPHVSGAAALLLSARPDLTPDEAEAVLRASAQDLGTSGYDIYTGDGMVDAAAALVTAVPDPLPELDPPTASVFSVTVTDPVANVVIDTTTYDFKVSTTSEPADAEVYEVWWPSPGNRCPSSDSRNYIEVSYEEFAPTVTVEGITDSICARLFVAAISPDGIYAEAFSPAVIGRDHTAPRLVKRSPRKGQTDFPGGRTLRITYSERLLGVTDKTVRLRDVTTGKVVKAHVWFSKSTLEIGINPAWDLKHSHKYQVEIRSGITDLVGNPLPATSWRFKTRPW
jgi:hypothetical protein